MGPEDAALAAGFFEGILRYSDALQRKRKDHAGSGVVSANDGRKHMQSRSGDAARGNERDMKKSLPKGRDQSMSKTIVEKILSRASGVDAHAGQIVTAPVDVMFCHDGNRPLGAEVFDTYGASRCATLSA